MYLYNSVSSPIIIIIGDVDRSVEGRVSLFGITVGGIVFRFFGDICHGHTDTIPSTLTHCINRRRRNFAGLTGLPPQ